MVIQEKEDDEKSKKQWGREGSYGEVVGFSVSGKLCRKGFRSSNSLC